MGDTPRHEVGCLWLGGEGVEYSILILQLSLDDCGPNIEYVGDLICVQTAFVHVQNRFHGGKQLCCESTTDCLSLRPVQCVDRRKCGFRKADCITYSPGEHKSVCAPCPSGSAAESEMYVNTVVALTYNRI